MKFSCLHHSKEALSHLILFLFKYADLRPGEQVSIHSLGLDVPLLLLVNLGFCRTPVGEGALVHHGGDSVEYRGKMPTFFSNFVYILDHLKYTWTFLTM